MPKKPNKWTAEEMHLAVDDYLDGKGLTNAAKALGRHRNGVRAVVCDKLPRNYRGCVKWMATPSTYRRSSRPFTITEDKYILKLLRNHRKENEIEIITGRPYHQIADRLKELRPQQPSDGFGLFKKED